MKNNTPKQKKYHLSKNKTQGAKSVENFKKPNTAGDKYQNYLVKGEKLGGYDNEKSAKMNLLGLKNYHHLPQVKTDDAVRSDTTKQLFQSGQSFVSIPHVSAE